MKAIKVLVLLLVVGCSPYPHRDYYELNDAITHAKTAEESEYYKAKLDRFNEDADAAVLFYEARSQCISSVNKFNRRTMWLCQSSYSKPRNLDSRPFKDVVDQVNSYRRDRYDCGCISTAEVMRGLSGRKY